MSNVVPVLVGLVVGAVTFLGILVGWGWWHAHMEARRWKANR